MSFGDVCRGHFDRDREIVEELSDEYGEDLVKKAIVRLESGAVSKTKFGWRIEVDPSLGDNRSASGSGAYWPRNNNGCMCWFGKANGCCSHEVAIQLRECGYRGERM